MILGPVGIALEKFLLNFLEPEGSVRASLGCSPTGVFIYFKGIESR